MARHRVHSAFVEERPGRRRQLWADATPLQRIASVVYATSQLAFLLLVQFGSVAALAGSRAAGYVLLVGLTAHFLARDFAIAVMAYAEGAITDVTRRERAFFAYGVFFLLLLVAGIYAGVFGWRSGAYVAVVGLTGHLLSHLALGATRYRRLMARPWPRVQPLDDDDDW